MTFQRYPEHLSAPLSLSQGVVASSSFTERAALDPATGRTLMYLALVKLGTGCAAPGGPDPVIRLKAGGGPVTEIGIETPLRADPTSDEPVAIATLTRADNVYVVEIEVLQAGSTWRLQIEHRGPEQRHEFTWVVADRLAEARQPWIHTPRSPVDFAVRPGEQQTRTITIANRGTGALTLAQVLAATLDQGFRLAGIAPASIGPHQCTTATFTFTGPTTPGLIDVDFTIDSNDASGGTQQGHNRVVRLSATTALAGSPPVVHRVDSDHTHPGETFAIVGANLVLQAGDDVKVEFFGPVDEFFDPERPLPLPAPVFQPTNPSKVVVAVPEETSSTHDHEIYQVTLRRSDGQVVMVAEEFFVAIL